MSDSLVIQSHRDPLPFPWLQRCLQSVQDWAQQQGFDYVYLNDELFDEVPRSILDKVGKQSVIATDLARLFMLQNYLSEGYQTVVWCDADFLIFNPQRFVLQNTAYALGREVWVQHDQHGRLKAYSKVHNAFLMFRRGNPFLNFYADTAERLLRLNQGSMPPQFIGPKLLSALHNIAYCPVQEDAGMLSPMVLRDIAGGGGAALELFVQKSPVAITAANLSSSEAARESILVPVFDKVIDRLLETKSVSA